MTTMNHQSEIWKIRSVKIFLMTIFALFSGSGDGRFREFHIKDKYKTVGEALKLFKDDELLSEPGESFTFA